MNMSALTNETNIEKKSVGTQYCLDENRTPLCGPLSWKVFNETYCTTSECSSESENEPENELSLAPVKLIRSCKECNWAYGHNVLRACGRKKIKDILVDSHECIINGETVGHWHHLVMSLYQNNSLEYAHVSVYIDGPKRRNDVTDFVLRNRECIKKIDFKTQKNIDDIIRKHYVN